MSYEMKNWSKIVEEKDKEIQLLKDKLQQTWILCSERLPERMGDEMLVPVEVTIKGCLYNIRKPALFFLSNQKFYPPRMGEMPYKNVIAWHYVPDAYEEGGGNYEQAND